MKIQVLSDLHLEFASFEIPETGADLLILAGDTAPGKKGIAWLQSLELTIPVIYILGNHEYYRSAHPKLIHDLKAMTQGTNIHVLENDALELNGVRFLGCTLWTDFNLHGQQFLSEYAAGSGMNDFRLIRKSPRYSKFTPRDARVAFNHAVSWLEERLTEKSLPTVIITHHAPSGKSIPEHFHRNELNPAYASNLEDFIMEYSPAYWIHGHIHGFRKYRIGNTWIICNARGYPQEPDKGFDPEYVIEIS
jgi:Icc-related predicted phosphoesterase